MAVVKPKCSSINGDIYLASKAVTRSMDSMAMLLLQQQEAQVLCEVLNMKFRGQRLILQLPESSCG